MPHYNSIRDERRTQAARLAATKLATGTEPDRRTAHLRPRQKAQMNAIHADFKVYIEQFNAGHQPQPGWGRAELSLLGETFLEMRLRERMEAKGHIFKSGTPSAWTDGFLTMLSVHYGLSRVDVNQLRPDFRTWQNYIVSKYSLITEKDQVPPAGPFEYKLLYEQQIVKHNSAIPTLQDLVLLCLLCQSPRPGSIGPAYVEWILEERYLKFEDLQIYRRPDPVCPGYTVKVEHRHTKGGNGIHSRPIAFTAEPASHHAGLIHDLGVHIVTFLFLLGAFPHKTLDDLLADETEDVHELIKPTFRCLPLLTQVTSNGYGLKQGWVPRNAANLSFIVRKLAEAVSMFGVCPTSFRRHLLDRAAQHGGDQLAQAFGGHTSPLTSTRHYTNQAKNYNTTALFAGIGDPREPQSRYSDSAPALADETTPPDVQTHAVQTKLSKMFPKLFKAGPPPEAPVRLPLRAERALQLERPSVVLDAALSWDRRESFQGCLTVPEPWTKDDELPIPLPCARLALMRFLANLPTGMTRSVCPHCAVDPTCGRKERERRRNPSQMQKHLASPFHTGFAQAMRAWRNGGRQACPFCPYETKYHASIGLHFRGRCPGPQGGGEGPEPWWA